MSEQTRVSQAIRRFREQVARQPGRHDLASHLRLGIHEPPASNREIADLLQVNVQS